MVATNIADFAVRARESGDTNDGEYADLRHMQSELGVAVR